MDTHVGLVDRDYLYYHVMQLSDVAIVLQKHATYLCHTAISRAQTPPASNQTSMTSMVY